MFNFNISNMSLSKKKNRKANAERKRLPAKTVHQFLQSASAELKEFFYRVDNEILGIGSDVVRYTTHREINYKTSEVFVYLAIQTRKNCLRLFIKSFNDDMIDPKSLTKPSRTMRLFFISPKDEQLGEYPIDYIMFLIHQSYDTTQLKLKHKRAIKYNGRSA